MKPASSRRAKGGHTLKKWEMSPYDTDIKSQQTCTHMKQVYSCADKHKDPVVHIKQTARAAGPCTCLKHVCMDQLEKTNSSKTVKEHTNEGQVGRGTLVTLESLGCNESIEEMRDEPVWNRHQVPSDMYPYETDCKSSQSHAPIWNRSAWTY